MLSTVYSAGLFGIDGYVVTVECNAQSRIPGFELVGLPDKGYKFPHELSGGEQQRIVIARAILNRPSILLADEPTGNLDNETGEYIMNLLHRISSEGTAVLMVTHNEQWLSKYPATVYRCEKKRFVRMP